MQNCKWTKELVTLGIAVVALASSLAPSKAQAQENFAWITNTNGVTWKKEIKKYDGELFFASFDEKAPIAEIVVPEHAFITQIDVRGCLNLTNLVIQPAKAATYRNGHIWEDTGVALFAKHSGLRNVSAPRTMLNRILIIVESGRDGGGNAYLAIWSSLLAIQWTVLEELPKMEFRTHSTDNGPELEIVWREGNLQIADAVKGKWKDYSGNSPLRIPLAVNSKAQQFFRIRKGDD